MSQISFAILFECCIIIEMTPSAPRGRPPLGDAARSERIAIYLSPAQAEALRLLSELEGYGGSPAVLIARVVERYIATQTALIDAALARRLEQMPAQDADAQPAKRPSARRGRP